MAQAASGEADTQSVTPNEQRAAFLTNLPSAVSWPIYQRTALPKTRFCMFGHDVVSADLKTRLMSGRAAGMTMNPDAGRFDFPLCDILYVPADEEASFRRWRSKIAVLPILTVGEGQAFLDDGGLIAFLHPDRAGQSHKNLCFRINNRKAEAMGIGFDAMLLELAEPANGAHE